MACLRPALVVCALLSPMAAASGAGGAVDQPGWVMFDYVGGTSESTIRAASALRGPGVVSVEFRYVAPGTDFLSGSSTTMTSLLGPTAAVATFRAPSVPAGHSVASELVLPPRQSGKVLVWSMSQDSRWSWQSTLAPDAQLTMVASGRSGTFLMGADADHGVHAHAAVGAGTSVAFEAEWHVDVEHLFVGAAGLTHEEGRMVSDRLYLTTPNGERTLCECRPTPRKEWTPGRYTLEQESFSVGPPRILLAGVDVPGFPRYNWSTK